MNIYHIYRNQIDVLEPKNANQLKHSTDGLNFRSDTLETGRRGWNIGGKKQFRIRKRDKRIENTEEAGEGHEGSTRSRSKRVTVVPEGEGGGSRSGI